MKDARQNPVRIRKDENSITMRGDAFFAIKPPPKLPKTKATRDIEKHRLVSLLFQPNSCSRGLVKTDQAYMSPRKSKVTIPQPA
jgi:hypothetical protein